MNLIVKSNVWEVLKHSSAAYILLLSAMFLPPVQSIHAHSIALRPLFVSNVCFRASSIFFKVLVQCGRAADAYFDALLDMDQSYCTCT